jgi:hypothetical protein
LQVKMLRKTPARQKPVSSTEWWGQNRWTFISILTQEHLAGYQISGEMSKTSIGYSMGSRVRIMHLGMQVFQLWSQPAGTCSFLSTSRRAELCSPFVKIMVPEKWLGNTYVRARRIAHRTPKRESLPYTTPTTPFPFIELLRKHIKPNLLYFVFIILCF